MPAGTFPAAYRAVADGDSLTDPALAGQLSEAQTNLIQVEAYLADHCAGG